MLPAFRDNRFNETVIEQRYFFLSKTDMRVKSNVHDSSSIGPDLTGVIYIKSTVTLEPRF